MATNREKYIDNVSNEDIAKVLCVSLNVYDNFVNCGREDYKELYQALSRYICSKSEEALLNHSSFNRLGEIEKWLSQEAGLSADEMFEELGYKLESKQASYDVYKNVKYKDKYDIRIKIGYDGNYSKQYDYNTPEYLKFIVKAEDKAIHKKIEELKNGQ